MGFAGFSGGFLPAFRPRRALIFAGFSVSKSGCTRWEIPPSKENSKEIYSLKIMIYFKETNENDYNFC